MDCKSILEACKTLQISSPQKCRLLHNTTFTILLSNLFNLHFWFKSFKFRLMFIAISFISRYFKLVNLFMFSRSLQSSLVALRKENIYSFIQSPSSLDTMGNLFRFQDESSTKLRTAQPLITPLAECTLEKVF